jgi:dienelactone hydrolase
MIERDLTFTLKTGPLDLILSVPFSYVPCASDRVVVSVPGYGESHAGGFHRHALIARDLAAQGIAATVLLPNNFWGAFLSRTAVRDADYLMNLGTQYVDEALSWVKRESSQICGTQDPKLGFLGYCMGATFGAISSPGAGTDKMLLFAPWGSEQNQALDAKLSRFGGDMHIVAAGDDTVSRDGPAYFYRASSSALTRELLTMERENHHFATDVMGFMLEKPRSTAFFRDCATSVFGLGSRLPARHDGYGTSTYISSRK